MTAGEKLWHHPGVAAAADFVQKSAIIAAQWRPSADFVAVTTGILKAPFAFGLDHFQRSTRSARDYLFDAGVVFLGATLLAGLAALIWPDRTLVLAQTVVIGVVLTALLVGNLVALALARASGRDPDTGSLAAASLYGGGFGLLWVSVFKLVGLFGPALVPGYSGSVYEALTVLGGMGGVLFVAFLLLEWPRRIVALEEVSYYASVAGLFALVGILLKVTGAA